MLTTVPTALYRVLTTVAKYDGETNPSVWLEDYRLACHNGGESDDLCMIKSISLYLADSTRAWLEHLPRGRINGWVQLQDAFVEHFQGSYAQPDNACELHQYWQKKGDSLRDYIHHFTKCCAELPNTADNQGITTFEDGTTCETLVHRTGQVKPKTIRKLLDLATNHAVRE
jgi:hypothetical protein